MTTIRNGSPVWLIGSIMVLTACGTGVDVVSKRSQGADSNDSNASASLVSTDPYTAVTQIQITKPYCRYGAELVNVATYCAGTVISDRFLLTAAHCFASDCPAQNKTISTAGILIPSAPTSDMNGYDWATPANTLKALNVAFVPGFTGWNRKYNMSGVNGSGIAVLTSMDMAIVDFGAGALSGKGYPALGYAEETSGDYAVSPPPYTPVGFGNATGTEFKRTVRPAMKIGLWSSKPNSTPKPDYSLSLIPNGVVGCYGDSGSPLLRKGVIIGVASTAYTSIVKGQPLVGSGVACDGNKSVTYSLLKANQLTDAMNALKAAGPKASVSLNVDLFNTDTDAYPASDAESRFIATFTSLHTTAPAWAQIANPAAAGKLLPSFYAGGVMNAIAAANTGARTSTWTTSGLTQGYYKVEIFYQKNAANATCTAVQYKRTLDTGFLTMPARLNQTLGTPSTAATTPVSGWLPVLTNVTPFVTSNAKSYIWVSNNAANGFNTGSLAIRLSDTGCAAGRMVADTIRLTLMSQTK